jgi:PAS domain S-box-containing protein
MKSLHEAANQFLMDSAEQGIFTTDLALSIVSWNSWMAVTTGKPAAEVVGRPLFEVFPELPERAMDRFYQEALQGIPMVISQRFHRYLLALERSPDDPASAPMRQSARIAPLLEEDRVVGTITIIEDVTERFLREEELNRHIDQLKQTEAVLRESEEKYRLLFSKERDAIIMFDAETLQILEVNEAANELFGYSQAELLAMNLADLSEEPEENRRATTRCLLEGSVFIPISWMRRKTGERFAVDISAGSFGWKGRRLICGIYRDITERLKMEEELLRTKKLEATGVLAGGIAHDFNNLLSIILGNIKLIQMDFGHDRPALRPLLDAERAAQRAADLTKKFLTFSRGGAPRKQVMAVGPLIADAAELVFSGSGVNWVLDLAQDLLPSKVDPEQLNEVLQNVLLNAREASAPGNRVIIRAVNGMLPDPSSENKNEPYTKIVVSDEGVGISSENLSRVFDPYFSTKMRGVQKGMGLGLSVAHSVIQQHGGRIEVQSEFGSGTTVEIWLPALAGVAAQGPGRRATAPRTPHRVLLMDDEEMFCKMAAEMLLRLDCKSVETAADGDEAVEKFRQALGDGEPFDLVILDLTIRRGRGGEEVIGELIKLDPAVKAVVTSGYNQDPVLANYAAYGFVGALAKPFRMVELQELIQAVASRENREKER